MTDAAIISGDKRQKQNKKSKKEKSKKAYRRRKHVFANQGFKKELRRRRKLCAGIEGYQYRD